MVDKVRDVPLVGGVHGVDVFYVVQVKQVGGALPVVQVPPLLRLVRRDDLRHTVEGDGGELTGFHWLLVGTRMHARTRANVCARAERLLKFKPTL